MLPRRVSCIYVRQPQALGLGHAVLCAQPVVGDNPFAVMLADDLIDARSAVMKQMVDGLSQRGASFAARRGERWRATHAAVLAIVRPALPRWSVAYVIGGSSKSPTPACAPSDARGVVGRYILTPRSISSSAARAPRGRRARIQLDRRTLRGCWQARRPCCLPIRGVRYDCGSKLGYLKANVAYGLKHPEVGARFSGYGMASPWICSRVILTAAPADRPRGCC